MTEIQSRYLKIENPRIVAHFEGQPKSSCKCIYCGYCSVIFDPSWNISFQTPQNEGQVTLRPRRLTSESGLCTTLRCQEK